MKKINQTAIIENVANLCQEANWYLGDDILKALKDSIYQEESDTGKNILKQIIENARIAATEKVPICQDTGFVVAFVEIGDEVQIDGELEQAINLGIKKGYQEGFLRNSIVKSPVDRINTGDNTPAVIHTNLVKGNKLRIVIAPKGGGSENMSKIKMLNPAQGIKGIKNFVLDTINQAGPNPCPPLVIGIGVGGTFEKVALLSKKALLRNINENHQDDKIADLERELLKEINKLGIGPQGLGKTVTALGVNIEVYPCHIASLPVAVNINCHAHRHKEVIL